MADYKLTDGTAIIRTSDNARIPADPDNMDYVAYQAWLAVSNTPDPYVATPLTPQDQFNSKLAAGMNATWTVSGIGAENNLNALYAVDPQTQFNITAESTVLEVIAWVAYGVPVLVLFLWRPRRKVVPPASEPVPATAPQQ